MADNRSSGYTVASTASVSGVNPQLLNALSQLAQQYGTIQIISGYRSPSYSARVGGYANDPHTRGEAVDAYINGRPIGAVIPLQVLAKYGLQGGNQPGFYQGKTDPEHVQIPGSGVDKSLVSPALSGATGVQATGNVPPTTTPAPSAPAAGSPPSAWPQSAQLAYRLAIQAGLNPTDAKDFASVQYGESGFDPTNYVGKSQGHSYVPYQTAGGLYQLLSRGYVDKANQLGGVFDPTADIKAILPNYVDYYKAHPSYVPGAAGATVEASGEPASYYAQGLQHLSGAAPVTAAMAAAPTTAVGRQPAAAAPPTAAPPAPAQGLPSIVRRILGVPSGRSSPAPAAAPTALPPIVRRILRA